MASVSTAELIRSATNQETGQVAAIGRSYPHWYTVVRTFYALFTLGGIAWIGLLGYLVAEYPDWIYEFGAIYPGSEVLTGAYWIFSMKTFKKSLISLILIDLAMTIIQIVGAIKENGCLMSLVTTYRFALALFYAARLFMISNLYCGSIAAWHILYSIMCGIHHFFNCHVFQTIYSNYNSSRTSPVTEGISLSNV